MTSILLIGVVSALAVVAMLAKTCAGEPKRAKKEEKREIIKQLLALSDHENGASKIASFLTKKLQPACTSTCSDALRSGTPRNDNSKRTWSPMSSDPPIPIRPNHDAEIEEQIRQRAHELYQGRGEADGNATDDWLRAKAEVLSFRAKAGKRHPSSRPALEPGP
jgi:Protein of unknown function (DUF2934)